MMQQSSVGVYYHSAAYQETKREPAVRNNAELAPSGLMGREVAGVGFLRALLRHTSASRIDCILSNESDRSPLTELCKEALAKTKTRRHVRVIPPNDLLSWSKSPTSHTLHFPNPPDPACALLRTKTRPAFAVSGVTHTLCTARALETLWTYLHTPWYPFDALICTSNAVRSMVQATIDEFCSMANDHGKIVHWTLPLHVIPLGVDTTLYKPATEQQRFDARRQLGIPQDHLAVLFVGRLSHHAKAHPHAMFVGAQRAAERSGKSIHILLCGWFHHEETKDAFLETAQRVASLVRIHCLDGVTSPWRYSAHHAADIFASLSDNIQETFGLAPLEAMSAGLPVIASDWNGYRDIVVDGETGFLIPTSMVRNATIDVGDEYLRQEINYDHFLAKVNQTVTVSVDAFAERLTLLVNSPDLRKRYGEQARRRAYEIFEWRQIISQYESLWDEQARIWKSLSATKVSFANTEASVPKLPRYPQIDQVFASYPSQFISDEASLAISDRIAAQFNPLLQDRLCNYSLDWIDQSSDVYDVLLHTGPTTTTKHLVDLLMERGLEEIKSRKAVAWLLKYDLIRLPRQDVPGTERVAQQNYSPLAIAPAETKEPSTAQITFVLTCKARLEHLKQTLPRLIKQPYSKVIVVDYDCPESSGDWVQQNIDTAQVIRVHNRPEFLRSEAKNIGGFAVQTPFICFLDADIFLADHFMELIRGSLASNRLIRNSQISEGTGGTFICPTDIFRKCGGHDPVYRGWGEEDDDLLDALRHFGCEQFFFPSHLVSHLEHDDDRRMEFHSIKDRSLTHMINRVYRALKWDLIRIQSNFPDIEKREFWYKKASEAVQHARVNGESTIEFNLGEMLWKPLQMNCARTLKYSLTTVAATQTSELTTL